MQALYAGRCSRKGCGKIVRMKLEQNTQTGKTPSVVWAECPQCSLHVPLTAPQPEPPKLAPVCADCAGAMVFDPRYKHWVCRPCEAKG